MASSLLSMAPLARRHLIPVAPKVKSAQGSLVQEAFCHFHEPFILALSASNSKRGSNSRQVFVEKKQFLNKRYNSSFQFKSMLLPHWWALHDCVVSGRQESKSDTVNCLYFMTHCYVSVL